MTTSWSKFVFGKFSFIRMEHCDNYLYVTMHLAQLSCNLCKKSWKATVSFDLDFYLKAMIIFGSFGILPIMLYAPSSLVSLVSSLSAHTSLGHRFKHRNLIFGINMYICLKYTHIRYKITIF